MKGVLLRDCIVLTRGGRLMNRIESVSTVCKTVVFPRSSGLIARPTCLLTYS